MTVTLPSQHALCMISLLGARNSKGACPHPLLLALLNDTQCAFLKDPLLDTVASLLNLTEYFNTEATPGCRLFDNFTDHIFFHSCSLNGYKSYLASLEASSSSTLIVITDTNTISPRNM